MSAAREAILGRIRAATSDVPADEAPAWERDADPDPAAAYRRDFVDAASPVDRFAERVAEYRAQVRWVAGEAELGSVVGDALAAGAVRRVAVPADLPPTWLPPGVDVLDDPEPSVEDLDASDAAVTGCAAAIAPTGTIVLDGGARQGPRRLTLLPDVHVCIVRAEQVHASVPAAMAALASAIREGRPLTLISGPSATSDIELVRVEGVHGPRTLHVLIVRDT